jgi:hypothetical protein
LGHHGEKHGPERVAIPAAVRRRSGARPAETSCRAASRRQQPDELARGARGDRRRKEEAHVERYTCPRELLPEIESALAAEGYVVETPLRRAVGRTRVTVMSRGGAVISLHEDVAGEMADINVYDSGEAAMLAVLEELPRLAPPRAVGGGGR